MHKIFLPFLLLLSVLTAFCQKIPVPENYTIVDTVSGDLDKDNIKELVVTYNTKKETEAYESLPSELVIYKMQNGNWTVWKKSQQALLGSNDGGMMEDPYAGMEIQKGILSISHFGGSNWKWGHTDKYRYQNDDFYMIGYTENYGKICEEWTTVDFNLSTGKLVVEKEYQTCKDYDEKPRALKTESETIYKKGLKITLEKRNENEVTIVTPKHKFNIYIATNDDEM